MRLTVKTLIVAGVIALVAAPRPAHAEGFFGPWIGAAFSQGPDFREANSKTAFGGFLGSMGGGGIWGFDIDFGYTPNFFADSSVVDNNLFTVTGNLIVGPSIESSGGRGVRPYGAFGVGLIHSKVESTSDNKFGWDGAGGLMAFFSSNIGIRGDLRYFHSVNDSDAASTILLKPGSFHYWRGYVGLVIR